MIPVHWRRRDFSLLNIAVFWGELQLDTQRKILEGIIEGAKRDGNDIYVYALSLTRDDQYNLGEQAVAMNDDLSFYDGFIIYSESIYSSEVRNNIIRKIVTLGKPCASIDCPIPGMINISSNNEYAMRSLSRHLIDVHNIRTANFIGGPSNSIDAITRKRVFCEELAKSGLELDEKRFFEGDYYAKSGRTAVEYFEKKGLLDADVYVCANDQMALGAYYALADRGISVPGDVLMTGYDNIFEAANHYPRITSVVRYEEKIGLTAYDNVVKKVKQEKYSDDVVLLSEPVFSESCGCDAVRPISHRVVVNNYANKTLRESRYAEMVSDFAAEITNLRNYDDICERLKKYIPGLGADEYNVYLYESENSSDKIKIGMTYNEQQFFIKDNLSFGVNERYINGTSSNGGNIYIINSVHFGDKCFGVSVCRNSEMPLKSEFYRIFVMTLGSALEHINNYIKMQNMIKTLDEMWVFDPMTHIYNRAGFFKFADEMVLKSRYNKQNLFLLFIDVDGLKQVNDIFGHEAGDKLICEMADILRKCRNKDELLMRYGGDEFVVLGNDYNEENVSQYIDRIRRAMAERNEMDGRRFRIDASIGYHMLSYDDFRPLSKIIELADQQMYLEKREKHKRMEDKL